MRMPTTRDDWVALDQAWTVRFNRASHNHFWRGFFTQISQLGNGRFWYALMVGLLISEGETALPAVLHMLAVGVAGLIIYKLLKRATSRQRPFMRSEAIYRACDVLDEFSFPSGHTLHAVSFTIVALSYYPALAGLLVPFTLLVAASRPVLGLHYPSDVLAGALIGSVLAEVSFLLF